MSQALVRLSLAATLLAACGDPSEPSDEPQGGGAGTGGDAAVESSSNSVPRPEPGSCQLADPAFCETFDKPSPGGRGGDLDERLWSVAR
ncbi:MAG: hypothetical protein JNK04_14790, partial [Myxococcales bacterium]|nr:hypothetical protein [Myxococcales bacterium]